VKSERCLIVPVTISPSRRREFRGAVETQEALVPAVWVRTIRWPPGRAGGEEKTVGGLLFLGWGSGLSRARNVAPGDSQDSLQNFVAPLDVAPSLSYTERMGVGSRQVLQVILAGHDEVRTRPHQAGPPQHLGSGWYGDGNRL